MVPFYPLDLKRILQNKFFFFKPPDYIAKVIKITGVLNLKEFALEIIRMI
jgi:hypothetical protein